jgi:NADP-dependent 3-hydroxy acid dehydrogenase YdfG
MNKRQPFKLYILGDYMNNKWALITGSTSGIGEAVATQLAQQGCNLIICGRRKMRLSELKEKLESIHSVKVIDLEFNIQDKLQIKNLIEKNKSDLSKVSILINNAGVGKGVDTVDVADPDDWDEMIDTNIKGLLYMTRYMLPILKKHESADIINIGSVAGRWTYGGGAVYCGTKHAVRAISEGIRQDLSGYKIKVCCIEPGMVNTEFSEVRLGDKIKADQVYAGMTPLSASDIAETIVWTLKRPKHVNIQEMVIFPTDQASISQVYRDQ